MTIATINPATGETLAVFEPLTTPQIEAKLGKAHLAFEAYRRVTIEERARWMTRAAELLEDEKEKLGRLAALEMGKLLGAAVAEVEKCVWVCRFYAEKAGEFLADTPAGTDASRSFVRFQPLGPILAVMPWNFPFWQVFRAAAPAIMAGNVCLLKHASNVPQCALAIEGIFERAGFPAGVFQTLLIGSERVAAIVADDRIRGATLTGSVSAGAGLAAAAGKHVKKTVLELGGSDPFIVLESADLEVAVAAGVTARTMNNGQSCIAAKRFIIDERIADAFERRMAERFERMTIGDPMDPRTELGPLATKGALDDLDRQVRACVAAGARLLCGGRPVSDRPGFFYAATALADVPPGTPADREEFFGPVALLYRVHGIGEAIRVANRSLFGLGASAWTAMPDEAERLIEELEAGAVFVNGLVKSDPRLPFGGIKQSGYGRELAVQGIHEFVNVKAIWIK